jgi:hypothetical protein
MDFDRDWLKDQYDLGLRDAEVLAAWNQEFGQERALRELRDARIELGLRAKVDDAAVLELVSGVKNQVDGSNLGYKNITALLVTRGFCIAPARVLEALRVVDPDGIVLRKQRRLIRRQYTNQVLVLLRSTRALPDDEPQGRYACLAP